MKWSEGDGGECGQRRAGLAAHRSGHGDFNRQLLSSQLGSVDIRCAYPPRGALDVYVYNAVTNDQAPLTITELRHSSRRAESE